MERAGFPKTTRRGLNTTATASKITSRFRDALDDDDLPFLLLLELVQRTLSVLLRPFVCSFSSSPLLTSGLRIRPSRRSSGALLRDEGGGTTDGSRRRGFACRSLAVCPYGPRARSRPPPRPASTHTHVRRWSSPSPHLSLDSGQICVRRWRTFPGIYLSLNSNEFQICLHS